MKRNHILEKIKMWRLQRELEEALCIHYWDEQEGWNALVDIAAQIEEKPRVEEKA